jgi:hypothetical protein
MTPTRVSSRPDSLGDALRLLADALLRERALFASGVAGIGLGLVGLLVAGVHGPIIEPEGVLSKAITFDIALGIYVLTISLFVPLARFSAKGLARWRLWHVGLTCVAYGLENIQIARGLDPRFTTAGSPLDQALGGVFFLVASGLIVLFVMLAARLFSRQSGSDLLFLATRYAFACTILAFGAGLWMSLIGGPSSGVGRSRRSRRATVDSPGWAGVARRVCDDHRADRRRPAAPRGVDAAGRDSAAPTRLGRGFSESGVLLAGRATERGRGAVRPFAPSTSMRPLSMDRASELVGQRRSWATCSRYRRSSRSTAARKPSGSTKVSGSYA